MLFGCLLFACPLLAWVSFLLFHNLDFEAASFSGFSSKRCGLLFACPLLFRVSLLLFDNLGFEAASFSGFSSKGCGLKWSCIEIDGRWLYLRSPSIHMRCPYMIGRDSWVWDISLCWPVISPHEVGEWSHSVISITIIISLHVMIRLLLLLLLLAIQFGH